MKIDVPLRVVLGAPPAGVVYGIQRGRGSAYEVAFAQQPKRGDVTFEFAITAAEDKDGNANFLGEYVQGRPAGVSSTSTSGAPPGRPIPNRHAA